MKAITLLFTTLFILIAASCSTKHLNKQMTRTTDRQTQETSIKSKQNESYLANRTISLSDSANRQYRINIFPLDTFSFSTEKGFKGRASLIELIGTEHRVKQFSDSAAFTTKKNHNLQYDHESQIRETTTVKSKSLEKSKAGVFGTFMWIGIACVLGWVGWRSWRNHSLE